MKFFFISVFLLCLSAGSFAQLRDPADSLMNYMQAAKSLEFIRLGATQLRASGLANYGVVSLNYSREQGHFRVAQEAEKNRAVCFSTNGIATLERFKLLGYFSFKRSWDDSLAFNLKGIKDSDQPTYFIAGKAGNYERQTFVGGGIISYELRKAKLFLSSGVDYLYNSTAGSVDPRALVYTYRLIFNPELTYHFRRQMIGVGVKAGYGRENVGIKIKNEDFKGSQSYPLRIPYINYGYGAIEPSTSDFERNSIYKGLNLNYSGGLGKWILSAHLSYLFSEESNGYVLINNVTNGEFENFQVRGYQLNLLMAKTDANSDQQVSVRFVKDDGDNNLNVPAAGLKGKNYFLKTEEGFVRYYYLNKLNQRKNSEWAVGLTYKSVYTRSAVSSHLLDYKYLSPEIQNVQYWKTAGQDLFSLGIGLSGRLPLSSDVNIPIQRSGFSTGVVAPDYLYWSSKTAQVDLKMNYVMTKLIKKFKAGFSLGTSYLKPLNKVEDEFNSTFIPDKYYYSLQLGFHLYL